MRTKTRLRKGGLQKDKVNFDEGVKLWAGFYRKHMHRFALDYLQIPLFGFQMILLYMMNINNFFYFVASRGLGKSFLTSVYCCCRCILYPNTKIIVASGTKGQARLLISQKIEKELINMSPNLRREIKEIKVGANDAIVKFKNGSTIEAVASGESARGYRCNILILDEARLISQTVLNSILRPFLTVVRRPKFYDKPEYKDYPLEENKELYLTSAWYKSHHSYDKFVSFKNDMCKGKPYFVCAFPYQLAVKHGLLTQNRVESIKNEDNMNEITWKMEMEAIWYGENFA